MALEKLNTQRVVELESAEFGWLSNEMLKAFGKFTSVFAFIPDRSRPDTMPPVWSLHRTDGGLRLFEYRLPLGLSVEEQFDLVSNVWEGKGWSLNTGAALNPEQFSSLSLSYLNPEDMWMTENYGIGLRNRIWCNND